MSPHPWSSANRNRILGLAAAEQVLTPKERNARKRAIPILIVFGVYTSPLFPCPFPLGFPPRPCSFLSRSSGGGSVSTLPCYVSLPSPHGLLPLLCGGARFELHCMHCWPRCACTTTGWVRSNYINRGWRWRRELVGPRRRRLRAVCDFCNR